jgi:hypothetical protein
MVLSARSLYCVHGDACLRDPCGRAFVWIHSVGERTNQQPVHEDDATPEEFERARHASALGQSALLLQEIIDSSHNVEYLAQEDEHTEADSPESGGPPPGNGKNRVGRSRGAL